MTAWPVGRRPGPSTVHSRRPAGGRPAYGRRTAGLRPAWRRLLKRRFLQTRFLKTSFFVKKKVKFENYVFFMRMDLSEVFSGNFMFLQNAFFMKNHVTNQFCVIFCQNLCFWKTCIFMHKNMMLKFVFKKVQLYFFQHWAVAEKIKLRHDEFWKQAPVCLC